MESAAYMLPSMDLFSWVLFFLVVVVVFLQYTQRQQEAAAEAEASQRRGSRSGSADSTSMDISNKGAGKGSDARFQAFQKKYLVVYLLAMFSDWLQGPYVYALYNHYGFTKTEIGQLFAAGFGSSLVFGTIVGSNADNFGRKNNCLLYCVLYIASCGTKHFNNYTILMVGRILSGIATSILYSAFESWLVNEHTKENFDASHLSDIFSNAIFGNSLAAIIAGVIANFAASHFSMVAPFDLAAVSLFLCAVIISSSWSENYGDWNGNWRKSFAECAEHMKRDRKISFLGLIQSLFEGSMYIFVLLWTPAIVDTGVVENEDLPFGIIFSSFMVAIMIGSSIFRHLTHSLHRHPEEFMIPIFAISGVCLMVPVIIPSSRLIVLGAFVVFEGCVGIFWPAIGTMRGKYIPEEVRSTCMNFFRVPLNIIVVLVLLQNSKTSFMFTLCFIFLFLAAVLQFVIFQEVKPRLYSSESGEQRRESELESEQHLMSIEGDSEE
eukprot:Nk52_evm16s261 gene=Nk52_evmTU16s261